jgi:hypothetical protein
MTEQTQTEKLNGRELKAVLVDRCMSVARSETTEAQDAREANVFRVAALIFNYK